ncbi:nucleotidyltransferase domain-containing protein [Candidatus Woesearchaeota archaeon]|nr:nucleotidyltransferase domain-containing protein [Candidatus Woesearchaeota archaeon]MBW3013782.1 nucleotidyltransferase domain-containing protein [Candidatus Woesearchaeota archaeon]
MTKANVPKAPLITKLCKQIEKEKGIKILFAVENGSRAWRMESEDSDYDVRFVYHHPMEKYISLSQPKDVIEKYYDQEGKPHAAQGCFIDIVGFDVFKYLRLLINSNPTAIEWLKSDIVYYGKQNLKFRDFAFKCFKKISLFYHYQSLCRQNYQKYIKSKTLVSYKKYLYALRGLVNATYVQKTGKVPPIDFTDTVKKADFLPKNIRDRILKIIELKKSGREKQIIDNIPMFDKYLESFLKQECKEIPKFDKKAVQILEKELKKLLFKSKQKN